MKSVKRLFLLACSLLLSLSLCAEQLLSESSCTPILAAASQEEEEDDDVYSIYLCNSTGLLLPDHGSVM